MAAPLVAQIPTPTPAPPLPAPPPPASPNDQIILQFPGNPVEDILDLYERLTSKRIIRDSQLGNTPLLRVLVNEPVATEEAIHILESHLLLNGYVLIQTDPSTLKIINTTTGKTPRSEGVALYSDPQSLPNGEIVASYFMQLHYIDPNEASSIFQTHVTLHPYGSVVPVPNAQAVVITENSSLIRQLIALRELIDVPPAEITTEFIQLYRADAKRVADIMNELIQSRMRTGAPAAGNAPPAQNANNNNAQNQNAAAQLQAGLLSPDTQVVADQRTNRILVRTRPVNAVYLRNLIKEFDDAVELMDPYEHILSYVKATSVLPVLSNLLAEEEEDISAAEALRNTATQNQNTQNTRTNTGGGAAGGGSNAFADRLNDPDSNPLPESVRLGNTTLIADDRANSIVVIGPPEAKDKVRVMLEKLDKRPMQVYLSTVIGQLRLDDENVYGIDIIQRYTTDGNGNDGIAGSLRTRTGANNIIVDATTLLNPTDFPLPAGLTTYAVVDNMLDIYVNALESTTRFNILSRPTVYTTNNRKATILSGDKVAVPTSTITDLNNNNSTALQSNITYEDVVLKLEVIPLINSEREVTLEIVQLNDRITGQTEISGNQIPTISTQQLTTTVTVPNGRTVVLGGLVTDDTNKVESGIPYLSRIPIIGFFLRNNIKRKDRNELIVMIQPTVVRSQDELLNASQNEQNRTNTGREIRDTEWQLPTTTLPPAPVELTPFKEAR